MPGARWFPNARLNYARNLLRRRDTQDAIVFYGEDEVVRRLSYAELYREVAKFSVALRDSGVGPGDRVAAYMPNMPETIIALLATASLGAIFSSASRSFQTSILSRPAMRVVRTLTGDSQLTFT